MAQDWIEKTGDVRSSIPYGLNVYSEGIRKGRDYFTIQEGALKDRAVSVASFATIATRSRSSTSMKHLSGGRIAFDVGRQAISVTLILRHLWQTKYQGKLMSGLPRRKVLQTNGFLMHYESDFDLFLHRNSVIVWLS